MVYIKDHGQKLYKNMRKKIRLLVGGGITILCKFPSEHLLL